MRTFYWTIFVALISSCHGEFRQPEKTVDIEDLRTVKPEGVIYLKGARTHPPLVSGSSEYCTESPEWEGMEGPDQSWVNKRTVCKPLSVIPLISASDKSKSPTVWGWVLAQDGGPRWEGETVAVEFPSSSYWPRVKIKAAKAAQDNACMTLRRRKYPKPCHNPVVFPRYRGCMGMGPQTWLLAGIGLFFVLLVSGRLKG